MFGTGYIVQDYEQGPTLGQRLDRGPLPEGELRAILAGVLAGLAVVHDNAVLHRDLKPGNIMLRRDGTPVLIDFGAARDFAARHSRSVTAVATPGYAPPAQFGIGGQQGPWTDFYVLGAILYHCVTGSAPVDSLRRLRKDPLVPVSVAAAGRYDPVLLDVIDRMLAVNEEDRPASVESVQGLLSEGRPSPTRDFKIPRAPQRVRVFAAPSLRRRTVIAGSAAALALIIAVLDGRLTTGEWVNCRLCFQERRRPIRVNPRRKCRSSKNLNTRGSPKLKINQAVLLSTGPSSSRLMKAGRCEQAQ